MRDNEYSYEELKKINDVAGWGSQHLTPIHEALVKNWANAHQPMIDAKIKGESPSFLQKVNMSAWDLLNDVGDIGSPYDNPDQVRERALRGALSDVDRWKSDKALRSNQTVDQYLDNSPWFFLKSKGHP